MTNILKCVLISLFLWPIPQKVCIWLPSYDVNLHDSETFVISDSFESDLFQDEDEMIRKDELKQFTVDEGKYFRIHQMARRFNEKEMNDQKRPPRNVKKIKERNFDLEDPAPWQAGFVDKNGNFIQDNENVYYVNEMAKGLIDEKIEQKRQEMAAEKNGTEEKFENYDYANFKDEYNNEIKIAERQNDTLNFTEVKEEESVKDAVDTIIDFKAPKNCSAEEAKGIGLAAVKCFWTDIQRPRNSTGTLRLIEKVLRLTLIWFCIYAVIAVPCWCQRGWCCCCCWCKFCRPRRTIEEAKQFFMDNPVGVLHTDDGEKITYQPTHYEKYAQKRLEKALMSL